MTMLMLWFLKNFDLVNCRLVELSYFKYFKIVSRVIADV